MKHLRRSGKTCAGIFRTDWYPRVLSSVCQSSLRLGFRSESERECMTLKSPTKKFLGLVWKRIQSKGE